MSQEARRKRALLSVTDKEGITSLGEDLVSFGYDIVSTGGTAEVLKNARIPHILVEDLTGFPEILSGRVKTLHPKIFGGILADPQQQAHLDAAAEHGISLFDVVVVNFYNFKEKPSIERIDIGGPAMLRAAGKNFQTVAALSHPDQYGAFVEEIALAEGRRSSLLTRAKLAAVVFQQISVYDAAVAYWFEKEVLPNLPA